MDLIPKNIYKIIYGQLKSKNNNKKFNILKIINPENLFKNDFIILLTLIIIMIPSFLSKSINLRKLILNYEITIKIRGTGDQKILHDIIETPIQIYLNDDLDPINGTRILYGLTSDNNTIKMIWNSPLLDCSSMFYGLNIIEVDFSNFDSSKVINMSCMFSHCGSLASINFTNFDTSSVLDFQSMFYGCNHLLSLDLRSFNTSSVTTMYQMFYGCQILTSVDLSSFNTISVTNMYQMFFQSFRLESLDLSNFDTSSVTTMFQMFYGCEDLNPLNISNFNTARVTDMFQMFSDCFSLTSLDLSSFDTSSVVTMFQMFHECRSLKSLNLSNFNTEKVNSMVEMFSGCNSLETLDVSNFCTSNINNLGNFFSRCYNLKSLDLSSFDTSNVLYIDNMFNGCNSLTSLDISNFDTSSAENAGNMFRDCYNLKSIDISHFNTSKVNNMNGMFFQCYSLEYLELGNLDTSSVTDMRQMFYSCNSLKSLNLNSFNTDSIHANCTDEMFINLNNFKYCINDKISEEFKSQLSSFIEMNCSDLCSENSSNKYIVENNKCIDNCNNSITFKYEYDNICYASCPNGTHLKDNNICEKDLICNDYYNYEQNDCLDHLPLGYYLNDTSKKTIDKCDIKCNNCSLDSVLNNLCISCNNSAGYYAKLNGTSDDIVFLNCFKEEEIGFGYYFDNIKNFFLPCYYTCKACNGKGTSDNNQCLECFSNYTLINGNCYFISDIDTTVIERYVSDFISDVYSTINDYSDITTGSIYSYEISDDLTQQKEEHKNVTFINFSEEFLDYLYKKFNLNKETEKIYVIIADNLPNDTATVTSDYTYKFILENGTELNLSNINEDVYVDFYVPITDLEKANYNYSKYFLNQGYDIYDQNSDFYNDFCTPAFDGENDMTLEDRKKYIYPNNVTLCKENCKYNGVDTENERIICSCNLNSNNEGNDTQEDENFSNEDNDNFLSYFLDNINYNIFKCYKLLVTFSNLEKNYAFFTILTVFFVILVLNLIYFFYFLPKMKKSMLTEAPTKESVKEDIKKALKKFRFGNDGLNNPIKKKKRHRITTKKKKKKKKESSHHKAHNCHGKKFEKDAHLNIL